MFLWHHGCRAWVAGSTPDCCRSYSKKRMEGLIGGHANHVVRVTTSNVDDVVHKAAIAAQTTWPPTTRKRSSMFPIVRLLQRMRWEFPRDRWRWWQAQYGTSRRIHSYWTHTHTHRTKSHQPPGNITSSFHFPSFFRSLEVRVDCKQNG